MATVLDVLENLKSFNIEVVAKQSIAATSNIMADENRKQLKKGQKADGTIMDNYSKVSQDLFNKPDSPITLYDTGAFHKSITVDVGADEFEFIADDIHDLEKRFTNEIYGLTQQNSDNYAENTVLPLIQDEFTKVTGLTFN
ncbi:MAG TPA: hypothetical protein VIK86_05610 [Candidatus Paceibacterota bacterium]